MKFIIMFIQVKCLIDTTTQEELRPLLAGRITGKALPVYAGMVTDVGSV